MEWQWAEARATVFTGDVTRDRQLLIEVFLVFLCIVGSTTTTVFTQDTGGMTNPQLGFLTGFSVLVVLITRCAISKYFITFTFDMFSKVALVLAVGFTGIALAILHWGYQSNFITYSAVGAGGYFAAELLVTSVFIWRSYDWRLSRTVALLIGSDLLLILAVIITLIVRPQPPFDHTLGLALLMVWLLVLTSAGIGYLWSHRPAQSKYPWLLPTAFCSLAFILMLVAIILSMGMLAFTVICIITTLSLLAYGLGHSPAYHVRSNFILPIWEYDSQKDVFRQANASVLATFAGLWLLLLWAGVAEYTRVTTIPSLVSAFSVSLLYMYTMHAVHSDQTSLERLCKDLTPEMVAQAVTATKKQLAGSAAQSAPPAQSAVLVTVVDEASDKLLSDSSRVNFAHVTDTCSEDSMLQFGSPAHGQLNRVFVELHSLLCAALLELQGHTDVAKKKLATGRSTPADLAALVSFRASLWTLQVEASAFAANLLMLLSMAAHYASAEQEKAMAGVLDAGDGGKAAARIANWPRHQLALVTDMRAAWVAHGGGAGGKRRKSASRLVLSMRPDQADSSGVDAKLGRTQRQVLTELATTSSTSIQQASSRNLLHSSSSSSPDLEETARFEDASFPPEAALDEAAKGAVCAGLEATPQPTWERAIDLVQELSLDDPVVFLDRSELLPLSVQVGTELETLADLGRADEENFGVALRLVLVQAGSAARVRRLFNSDQPNLQGVYSLQLFSASRRRWETVLIDDRLPCKPQTLSQATGATQPPQLLAWHARSTRACELWIPLLHKAAAKFVGSYHTLAKMPVQNLVVMLVGGLLQSPPLNHVLPTVGGAAEAWQNMELWLKAGCLVLLEPKPQARKRAQSVVDEEVSVGGDGSSVGLLKSWHLAVAVHSAGKVQLVFLQSPKMTRSPTTLREDTVQEVSGESTWRAQSFARASVRRGVPRDAQRTAKWLGMLDVPLSCHAVHVVRSPADWKETVLSGMLCTPASDRFAGLSASLARHSSSAGDSERGSASQRPTRNPRECKFQLHPVAAHGEALEPPPPGMAIAVHRLDGAGGATSTAEIELHVSMTSSDIAETTAHELLAHVPSERTPLFFADAPIATMPIPPEVYVFTVALKGAQDPPDPVYFTALVHTPQRMLVSQYFSDKERVQAVLCIAGEMRRWSDRNKLIKLKRREFRRRKGLEELVDVHKRFLEMLRVLRDLWRHEIFRLTHLEDNSSADDLVR